VIEKLPGVSYRVTEVAAGGHTTFATTDHVSQLKTWKVLKEDNEKDEPTSQEEDEPTSQIEDEPTTYLYVASYKDSILFPKCSFGIQYLNDFFV